ncbi:MAG TPA: hypothetical protein VL854_00730 [Nitrososphaeraceae archaeon]|jgi:hypothetical protein|nr:hypothetical protein [Nitrososphaeraceae archaeon]
MNYNKVDAALAAALKSEETDKNFIPVFVGVNKGLGQNEKEYLQKLGLIFNKDIPEIITATISQQAISELSDQSWVRYLKLSTRLKPK